MESTRRAVPFGFLWQLICKVCEAARFHRNPFSGGLSSTHVQLAAGCMAKI